MNDDSTTPVDRRSVLKHLGVGSVVAIGGAGTANGQGSASRYPIDPGSTFEPTVSEQGIETAKLTVHEASISTHVRVDGETLSSNDSNGSNDSEADESRLETHGERTANGVRLRLDPDELPRSENASRRRVHPHTEREPGDELLQVERSRRSADAVTTQGELTTQGHRHGMADEPSTGSRDVAVYGQTESQECGPLARTAVRADRTSSGFTYNETPNREHVDGNACRGHQWDGKFEAFCDYLGWIPGYDCGVPRVFDTSWHVEGTGFDGSSAQTLYACYDFPAVPDTVVVAQDVTLESGRPLEVSYESTIGVSTEDDISDYDWDSNGIANLVVDGIGAVLATGGWSQAFTLALSAYLLEQNQGIVS